MNYTKILSLFTGKTLHQVFYAESNYTDRDFDFGGFHLCDQAVLLRFSDGSWLNWIWIEEGKNGSPEYVLQAGDMRELLLEDEYTVLHDAHHSPAWKELMDHAFSDFGIRYLEKEDGNSFLLDITLYLGEKSVTIASIAEPQPDVLPELRQMNEEIGWTAIVFDLEILKKFQRGPFSKRKE